MLIELREKGVELRSPLGFLATLTGLKERKYFFWFAGSRCQVPDRELFPQLHANVFLGQSLHETSHAWCPIVLVESDLGHVHKAGRKQRVLQDDETAAAR